MRTLQEKYNAIQEGKFSKENFIVDARRELPNLITRFNGYDDAVQILKNRGMISENKYSQAEEQLQSAPIGAKATGGGYGPFEKVTKNTWKNIKAGSLQHSQALASHIGGFEDFKIQESTREVNINEARLTKNSLTDYRYKPTNDMDKYPYEQILRGLRVELEGLNINGVPNPEEYKKALAKVLKNLEKDEIFYTNQLAGNNKKVDLHDKMVDVTEKNTVDTFNGMKKVKDLKEDHSKNPNDKYVVRPCKNKKEPWAVWEGETRVKGFATKEEAKEYADKQNKKQELTEIGMFHDPIGYSKSETDPADRVYTKKFVGKSDKVQGDYVYDIFKNGVKVATIDGEGNANAWISNVKRKDNSQKLTEKVLKEGIKNLIKKVLMENEEDLYEMQGSKTEDDYKSELADYLEDNQIYGYTRRIHDIMTGPDEAENVDELVRFLEDNQIYGYNRRIEAIYADYHTTNNSTNQPDEYKGDPGYQGYESPSDRRFNSDAWVQAQQDMMEGRKVKSLSELLK